MGIVYIHRLPRRPVHIRRRGFHRLVFCFNVSTRMLDLAIVDQPQPSPTVHRMELTTMGQTKDKGSNIKDLKQAASRCPSPEYRALWPPFPSFLPCHPASVDIVSTTLSVPYELKQPINMDDLVSTLYYLRPLLLSLILSWTTIRTVICPEMLTALAWRTPFSGHGLCEREAPNTVARAMCLQAQGLRRQVLFRRGRQ